VLGFYISMSVETRRLVTLQGVESGHIRSRRTTYLHITEARFIQVCG
jgi:hypothetical protein